MADSNLRLLVIGAHPDDADLSAGGTIALYRAAGHTVKMVSVTNGDAGHHQIRGPELAKRRKAEALASGATLGATYDVLDNHDGQLQPTLENRYQIIRLIRTFKPDLVLTHRPNDYHPDHRYVSQLVQDAAYMVTVPPVCPDVPHLMRDPVIAYLPDDFQRPYPFSPTVAVEIDAVIDKVVDMLHCHESQFYEWLPYNAGYPEKVPKEAGARKQWLRGNYLDRIKHRADRYRDLLIQFYGKERGAKVQYAEAFEGCEYGAPLNEDARKRLFPFVK